MDEKIPKEIKEEIKRLADSRNFDCYIADYLANIRTKDRHIVLYIEAPSPISNKKEWRIEINWSCLGSVSIGRTKEFCNNLNRMISIAEILKERIDKAQTIRKNEKEESEKGDKK